MRTWQEQKKEAEAFELKINERDLVQTQYYLWKLYHYQQKIDENNSEIDNLKSSLNDSDAEITKIQSRISELKADNAKITKKTIKLEKDIGDINKIMAEKRPQLLAVQSKFDLTTKNDQKFRARKVEADQDESSQNKIVKDLRSQLSLVKKAREKYEKEWSKKLEASEIKMTPAQQKEYSELTAKAITETSDETMKLEQLNRKINIAEKALSKAQEKKEDVQHHLDNAISEVRREEARKEQETSRLNKLLEEREEKKNTLKTFLDNLGRINQNINDLNEQLLECLKKLSKVDIYKDESKREANFRETLAELKRVFTGVRGAVSSLVTAKNHKFDNAVASALGMHNNSIIVNDINTAKECIKYLRDGRKNQCTFLPLDSVTYHSADPQLRNISKKVRLAIDVMDFDSAYEKVVSMICSNTIICDDISVAKEMIYQRGLKSKGT